MFTTPCRNGNRASPGYEGTPQRPFKVVTAEEDADATDPEVFSGPAIRRPTMTARRWKCNLVYAMITPSGGSHDP